MRLVLVLIILMLSAAPAFAETVYERINRTQTLRCGYIEWPGYVERDAKTGKMSGMAYDVAQALGKELGIKIEWTESVGWANYQEGLNTGRYDVACAGLWESGNRARISLMTRPAFYSGMYVAVRASDNRFDKDFTSLNDKSVKIETIEADVTQAVKDAKFPNATTVAQSPGVDSGAYLMNVATNKADAVFISIETLAGFNASNKDKQLKLAAGGKTARIFGNSFAVKNGEMETRAMLDTAIDALVNDGTLDSLVAKHGKGFIGFTPGYKE